MWAVVILSLDLQILLIIAAFLAVTQLWTPRLKFLFVCLGEPALPGIFTDLCRSDVSMDVVCWLAATVPLALSGAHMITSHGDWRMAMAACANWTAKC